MTMSKFWNYKVAIIMMLLVVIKSCKKEEPEPEQIPIVTIEVSDISPTSARCTGNIISCQGDWGSSVSSGTRGICWSNINVNPTISGNYENDISGYTCSFTILLDGLTPGTRYYLRGYAENIVAGIGYSNVIEFSTTGSVVGDILFNMDLTYGSLSDIEGNTYKTIEIGNQTWMAENLKTSKYNDGTDIPNIISQQEWINLTTPGYCWYLNNESKYKATYGGLYNWYTVKTGKLCPTGWHVPNLEDWATLFSYLGGDEIAVGKTRESGTTHWITTNLEVNNSSGFTALPGGTRDGFIYEPYPSLDYFINLGYAGDFWSVDEERDLFDRYIGSSWYFYYDNSGGNWAHEKPAGLSVRCVKD